MKSLKANDEKLRLRSMVWYGVYGSAPSELPRPSTVMLAMFGTSGPKDCNSSHSLLLPTLAIASMQASLSTKCKTADNQSRT